VRAEERESRSEKSDRGGPLKFALDPRKKKKKKKPYTTERWWEKDFREKTKMQGHQGETRGDP